MFEEARLLGCLGGAVGRPAARTESQPAVAVQPPAASDNPLAPGSPAQPRRQVRHFENAIECETMKIVAKSGDIPAAPQPLYRNGGHRW